MKKTLFLLLSFISFYSMFAQEAVKIPAFAKERHPMSWYQTQIKAWDKMIKMNPSDENAWYNYYSANRILIFHDEAQQPSLREKDQRIIDLVERMGEKIPNSYTYNFCKWQLGGNNMAYYSFLEKAIAIDSNRIEHIDYMINIGELQRNLPQRDAYSLKKIQTRQMSAGMMYYNYNVLIGLEKNAILLTCGDNDTYPAWALQAKGIRKDVKVINLYLLLIKEYREKIFAELGMKDLKVSDEQWADFFKHKLVSQLQANKQQFPVYIALTCMGNQPFAESVQQDLYLVGLTYLYKKESFDNIAILKKNMEQLFALDYLDRQFYDEISTSWVKEINRNYIVPMIKLYQHYTDSGEGQKKAWIKEKLILVSQGTEDEETVLKYIN